MHARTRGGAGMRAQVSIGKQLLGEKMVDSYDVEELGEYLSDSGISSTHISVFKGTVSAR